MRKYQDKNIKDHINVNLLKNQAMKIIKKQLKINEKKIEIL